MPPAVTVLQLDTDFPRITGDVACPNTYRQDFERLLIEGAFVRQIVHDSPDVIDIKPFETAISQARGDVIVTSCGFLAPWQDRFAGLTDKPVISSALIALERLSQDYQPGEVLIVTFDAAALTAAHLGPHAPFHIGVIGLPDHMHLRQVINQNRQDLDEMRVIRELTDLIRANLKPHHKHILLECTNLPPYKPALRNVTQLPITDILTLIEAARPGTVKAKHL